MAGVLKLEKENRHVSCEIEINGALLSSTRASLVIELVQYFLYERQQIPLPTNELNSLLNRSDKPCRHKKVKTLLEDLEKLFDKLKKAFEYCPEIKQVAILLGGTVVSPKESYIIQFPPPCPDADSVSWKTCKRNLFQQIIGDDCLGSLRSNFAPTDMTLLVCAPRSGTLDWFLPKQNLKSPKSGTVISFNINCSYQVPIKHDLTLSDTDLEVSGLEPINCSQCESENSLSFQNDGADQQVNHETIGSGCQNYSKHSYFINCESVNAATQGCNDMPIQSPDLPRFCHHQRLNYIFSSKKPRSGQQKFPNSARNHEYVADKLICESEAVDADILSQKIKILNCSPISHSDIKETAMGEDDFIFYQSPVVIKGLKKQDLNLEKP